MRPLYPRENRRAWLFSKTLRPATMIITPWYSARFMTLQSVFFTCMRSLSSTSKSFNIIWRRRCTIALSRRVASTAQVCSDAFAKLSFWDDLDPPILNAPVCDWTLPTLADRNLWVHALEYFAGKEGCKAQIMEVLGHIDKRNLLPPLLVIDALARNSSATLAVVKVRERDPKDVLEQMLTLGEFPLLYPGLHYQETQG